MDLEYFLGLFFSGVTRGSIYALIALGYTMVYGIIELINFAHGEIYMIGMFTGLLVASALGMYGFPALGVLVVAGLAAVVWCAATPSNGSPTVPCGGLPVFRRSFRP